MDLLVLVLAEMIMVSIIIPMYNGEATIEKTVKSCLYQTYSDIEIIVVDDHSSDDSVSIVKKIMASNRNITLICNDMNMGLCKNANKGIISASGQFLLMLGQDDLLKENHIQEMLTYFHDDTSMVYCNCSLIDENDTVYKTNTWSNKELTVNDFVKNNAVSSCGALLRKASVDKCGGYPEFPEYPNYGEWYLWIELATVGKIVPCDSVLSLYRRHKNNISNTFNDPDKIKKLNHYANKCRRLAISKSSLSLFGKMSAHIYILLKNMQINAKYIFTKNDR